MADHLLTILTHWFAVNTVLLLAWGCWLSVRMADAEQESDRKARCKDAAERIEASRGIDPRLAKIRQIYRDIMATPPECPADLLIGTVSNPLCIHPWTEHEDFARYSTVEQMMPKVLP